MPIRNKQVKRETRVAKVLQKAARKQLNRLPVAGKRTKRMLPKSAFSPSVSLDGMYTIRSAGTGLSQTRSVPVIGLDRKPLMPTTPWRAERWIKSGKATPFWSKGIFCVRLNIESGKIVQDVACGIDPGSKKEGFTLKSEARTFLNIQVDAITWVKDAVKIRREMRRNRRNRKTPCRANRMNRIRGGIPPSTKARWGWKLRLANQLSKLYPISKFIVEDIKARTKGQRKWDVSFSPLEVGKQWFYTELKKIAPVETKSGWETKGLRDNLGLKKSKAKLGETFDAHCVDSWVLANWWTGGHAKPDNTRLLYIAPLQFHRRQLYRLQPAKGGTRKAYGGTRSSGLKRGSLIKHPRHGLTYVGGTMRERISLHSISDGRRLCQNASPSDCKFLAYNTWRRK